MTTLTYQNFNALPSGLQQEVLDIYSSSFPIFEQRTQEQLENAFTKPEHHFLVYMEQDKVIGLLVYWNFNKYAYIEHYAIHSNCRGKSYGSKILSQFIQEIGIPVILEIDPIVDAVSQDRYKFYQHLGFYKNDYPHTHPAYRKEFKDHELVVLSSGAPINIDLFQKFQSDLLTKVMARHENHITDKA